MIISNSVFFGVLWLPHFRNNLKISDMEIRRVTLPRSSSPFIENQSKNSSRPVSFYDNFKGNIQSLDRNGQNRLSREICLDRDKSPTMAHCLNTTVPQNITALSIAGRHTPTRSSLRHSRMIVMNKTGTGKYMG